MTFEIQHLEHRGSFLLDTFCQRVCSYNERFVTLCFLRAFESEVRMYDGDDPLDVWDR